MLTDRGVLSVQSGKLHTVLQVGEFDYTLPSKVVREERRGNLSLPSPDYAKSEVLNSLITILQSDRLSSGAY